MKYQYLIFDVDDTLLNFRSAYSHAQRAVAAKMGVPYSQEFIRLDEKLGWRYWDEFGLGDTGNQEVQKAYHKVYAAYLEKHFTSLSEMLGVAADISEVVDTYFSALATSREPVEPDSLEVFSRLAKEYKLVLATNGIGWVQRARLAELLPIAAAVFISEEIGAAKPAEDFFRVMLNTFGCAANECLMIGDSLSNDIAGAQHAGMHTCWYNHKNHNLSEASMPDYIIHSIHELDKML